MIMSKMIFHKTAMRIAAVMVAVVSLVSCSSRKSDEPQIETYEQALARFNALFGIDKYWSRPFEVYPDNRLYVDIKNQQLCFVDKDKDKTLRWAYAPATGTMKTVSSEDADSFVAWVKEYLKLDEPDFGMLAQEIEIDARYMQTIAGNSIVSERDKVFSLIYNALVGDPLGFISAYIDADGRWVKVGYSSYGKNTLDKDRFLAAVAAIGSEDDLMGLSAYDFLKKNEIIGKAETPYYCYWNFRDDNYYVFSKDKYALGLTQTAEELEGLRDQILDNPDKMFVMIPDKMQLVDLASFYSAPKICLNIDKDYLSGRKYVRQEDPEKGNLPVVWILIACAVVFVTCAGVLLYVYRGQLKKLLSRKKERPQVPEHKHEQAHKHEEIHESDETVRELKETVRKLKVKADRYDRLQKSLAEGKPGIKEVLAAVDDVFDSRHSVAYKTEIDSMGTYAKLYHDFIGLVSEGAVMENLDAIRKKHEGFPEIKTVGRLLEKSRKASDATVGQIDALLENVDPAMHAAYRKVLQEAGLYARIGRMFRNNDSGLTHDRYLENLVDNAVAIDDRLNVDKYIDFALQFKATDETRDSQLTSVASATRDRYAAIDDAVEGLVDSTSGILSGNEPPGYWDRLSFLLSLSAVSKKLFEVRGLDHGETVDIAVEAFKRDMLYLYMTRNFVAASKDSNVDAAYFENEILGHNVVAKVGAFNAGADPGSRLDMEEESIKACMEQCVESLRKIRREEAMTETLSLMWDKFAREFAEKFVSNRDKGWLLGNSVQMSLYMSDFLRHFVGGSEEYYCSNYAYLRSGELADCDKDFSHNDYRYSDELSNFVYDFLKEFGAEGIEMIVNNFRIKM